MNPIFFAFLREIYLAEAFANSLPTDTVHLSENSYFDSLTIHIINNLILNSVIKVFDNSKLILN